MLKILIAGGFDESNEDLLPKIQAFAQLLGEEVILQGHILLNACRTSFDHAVAESANAEVVALGQNPTDRIVSYVLREDKGDRDQAGALTIAHSSSRSTPANPLHVLKRGRRCREKRPLPDSDLSFRKFCKKSRVLVKTTRRKCRSPQPVPETQSASHPRVQRTAFRRRGARLQSRLFASRNPPLKRNASSIRLC